MFSEFLRHPEGFRSTLYDGLGLREGLGLITVFILSWIAGVGLTCMLLLIVVLMALGLMCGICGHDKESVPTTRGSVSNMGGLSLMA